MKNNTFYLLAVILIFTSFIGFSKPGMLDNYGFQTYFHRIQNINSIENHVSFRPHESSRPIAIASCQDINVYLDMSGNASIVAADIDNGSVGDGFSIDISTFSCSDIGAPVTVTLMVTDSLTGLSDSCTSQVTVLDNINPSITLTGANPQTIEACSTYTELGASVNDNCAGVGSLSINASAVNTSIVGTYSVTYDVTDASGNNAAQVTRTVNVVDTTDPTITLNGIASVTVEACGTYIEQSATADDGCMPIGAVTIGGDTVDTTTVGTYTLTYNVSDAEGNAATQMTRTVYVEDSTPPTITLNGAATIIVEACDIYTELGATANDGCLSIGSVTIGGDIVDTTTVGTYIVTYDVLDASGNPATQMTRSVHVKDTTAPNAICQNTTIQLNETGNGTITVSDINNGSFDSCSAITLSASQTTFDCSDLGNNNITLTVTDAEGNTATCIAVVTVVDTIDPVTPILNTITAECSATAPTPTTTDACAGTVTGGTTDPLTYSTQGTHIITWTFDDGNGNTTSQTQQIIIDDVTPPTPDSASLPDITAECSVGSLTAPGARDNCNGPVTVTHNATLPITAQGTTVVTWTYDDGNGNTTTQTQNVIIDDITAPIPSLVSLPDITAECTVGSLTAPTARDNCDGLVTVTHNATLPITSQGTTVVTWTYDDGNGNTTTQTQNVVIEDVTNPDTPVLPNLSAECSLTVTPPTTTDNCDGIITGTTGLISLTFDTIGTDVIYWEFTDEAGNSIIHPQNITITDNAPTPDLPNLAPLVLDGCQITDISDLVIPTATDLCDGTINGSLSAGFVFPYSFSGTQTIDWEFIDSNGNMTIQSQDITLNPIPVDGGTLQGTFESTVFSNGVDISSCSVAINVDLNLSGEMGTIIQWEQYAVNNGVWEVIPDTDNNFTASFDIGALVSTYYRVLVQTGTCSAYSTQFFIRALPTGSAPTVTILDPDSSYCLGDTVNLLATSNYTATEESIPDSSGDFNQGQLNTQDPNGWLVDGEPGGFTAGGSATKPRNWSAKTCNNQDNGGIVYCGNDDKYTIAYGDYSSSQYRGANPTTLETPIMDLSNAESASLTFDQAYYFSNNDYAAIDISTDGGNTYSTLQIMHVPGTGDVDWFTAGTAASVATSDPTNYNFDTDDTFIDLAAYLGENNVRIKWSFTGTTDQSAWAMDNIFVNTVVVVETEIEWTDGIGNPNEPPIAEGATEVGFSFVPEVPGVHEYGSTALVNDCRTYDEDGTSLTTIYVSYSYAGENVAYTDQECGQNTVQLNAYDNSLTARENATKGAFTMPADCINCDDEGTGEIGTWSVSGNSPCGGGSFSNIHDPDALFTAEEGTYTLTWTVAGCESSITVTTRNCNQIDFDGINDYVDFKSNTFYLTGDEFSIEAWVKPEIISGDQTIFSKKDSSRNLNNGYDLSINNLGIVSFNANRSVTINSSPYRINTDRWYHIAVTYASGQYLLYIDGIIIKSTSGSGPNGNNSRTILGAMDSSNSSEPTKYFNGWIDELKLWNKAITPDQLHQMMNQKIIPSPTNPGNVHGETIPIDISGLLWNDLTGYFQMETLQCGYLESTSSSIRGKLKNISTSEAQTAPVPYTSRLDGQEWATDNTWTHWQVWDTPNSNGIDGSPIDWNIVQISHDIDSGDKNITLLGLISDTTDKELTISNPNETQDQTNSGKMLWVTHYLDLDGKIDLVGESQLIQKRYNENQINESVFNNTSLGYIERDQQGTANAFNYNYWGSPVSQNNAADDNSNSFSLSGILRDGTTTVDDPINRPISWIGGSTANSSNPAQISTRWLYAYINNTAEDYYEWEYIGNSTSIPIGLGYTMKGSGNATANQNYVFVGKPNNGTITTEIGANQQSLVGNPYPSAIDSKEFISDNPGITGTLYFWEHYSSNTTHITEQYEGGYAALNNSGGVGAEQHPDLIISNNGTKIPKRYIPVGQGFFVEGGDSNSNVIFKNSQRIFKTEAPAADSYEGSVFLRTHSENRENTDSFIKRVRLEFTSPEQARRPLLLAFVPDSEATDAVDWSYDGKNNDESTNSDLSWMIENEKYVIQGVGDFDVTKQYPLGLFLTENGNIKIALTDLENFDTPIDVFIYDSVLGTYTQINDSAFNFEMDAGDYMNRFFLTFQSESLSIDEFDNSSNHLLVNYLNNSGEIYINVPNGISVKQVFLFQIQGKALNSWEITDDSNFSSFHEIRIPVKNVSSGTYIVKVITEDNQTINKKIIIKQ